MYLRLKIYTLLKHTMEHHKMKKMGMSERSLTTSANGNTTRMKNLKENIHLCDKKWYNDNKSATELIRIIFVYSNVSTFPSFKIAAAIVFRRQQTHFIQKHTNRRLPFLYKKHIKLFYLFVVNVLRDCLWLYCKSFSPKLHVILI